MRVALVLGGGGLIGLAYHAAALAAIEHDPGWDPRSADVVVGTSAGSLVGALLRRGVTASDLSATTVGDEPRSSPPGMADALRERPEFPPVRLGSFLARPRLPSAALIAAWAHRPWRLDPIAALASVLPDGSLDLAQHATAIERVLGADWPNDELWLCTVRQNDLRQVVIGRDVWAPLSTAVCASCAIPGYFRPVGIGGPPHIGSPAGVRGAPPPAPGGYSVGARRTRARRRRCAGHRLHEHANLRDSVRAAFFDTGEQLRAPFARTLLAGLNNRTRPACPRPRQPAA
jgi:hypothetical protein